MSTELVMLSNYVILCGPLLLLSSVFPSIRIFSNESALLLRWPNYWSFSFSISPSSEYSGLISFRIDLFDLLAAQMTLNSIVASKPHNSKESTLWHLASSITQLSWPEMTTGKNITLTIWTFVSKVMSLLFNTLSRFVTEEQASFNLMTAITIGSDLGVQEKKICHCFHFLPFYLPWRVDDLSFRNVECWAISQLFHSPFSPSTRGSLVPLHFLPLEWYHLQIWSCWYFSQQAWFQLVILPARHFLWCLCI